jgi:phosphohistidine phosphatase SixA
VRFEIIAAVALLAVAQPSRGAEPALEKTPIAKKFSTIKKAAPAPTKVNPAVPNAATATIPLGLDSTLVNDLQHGGYIIFFRHCMTNWNERDGAEGNFADRSKQRNLSEAGQREASAIGQSLKVLEIPIEKVLVSPMWRCRDTAQFAFGEYDTTGLLYWKGATWREARVKMLSTAPAAGKNLVLVGHQDQLIPIVPGLKRDQLQEGDALVFRPQGDGKYQVVRQVRPFDWATLAGVEPPVPALPTSPDSTSSATDSTGASSKKPLDR